MKQLWNDQRSILLTRAVVALAIAGSVVMTVCGPKITHWMVTAHGLPPRSGPCCWGWGMPAPRWRWSCCAACISFCAALKRARSLFPPMLRLCGASAGVVLAQRDSACWQRGSICVPVLGGGGRVHGADRPGAEKRLCAGRPHEGRAGLHRVRGASRCLLWSIWMS